jgi:hypothetical protein
MKMPRMDGVELLRCLPFTVDRDDHSLTKAKTSKAQRHIEEAEGKAECLTIEAKPGCCEVMLSSW